jgi:hypothetical protein
VPALDLVKYEHFRVRIPLCYCLRLSKHFFVCPPPIALQVVVEVVPIAVDYEYERVSGWLLARPVEKARGRHGGARCKKE